MGEPDTLVPMRRLALFALAALVVAAPAAAQQVFEQVGSRALGMAGAFVAVADDATAVYWNPAGLATGGPAGMTIGWLRFRTGDQARPPIPNAAGATTSTFTSLGTWPIGVSYGRFQNSFLTSRAAGAVQADTLTVSDVGVTILQSVTEGVVIGSTLKYLRGFADSQLVTSPTAAQALDTALATKGDNQSRFDFDLGLMVDMQKVRVGLTVKNMREPAFRNQAGTAITLKRQARVGLAVFPTDGLTLAMDLDLDTVDLPGGLRRMIAFGGEHRLGSRVMARGGVRWNLKGERLPVAAVGASLALRAKRLWLDAHLTRGDIRADRGMGFALRAGF